jgi:hypothetical protein
MAIDLDEADIPTFYANTTNITVGLSDMSLHFGNDFQGNDGQLVTKNQVRIILTHDHFMRMMAFWGQRYQFLFEVYGDKIPVNLADLSNAEPERFRKLVQKYLLGEDTSQDNEETDAN